VRRRRVAAAGIVFLWTRQYGLDEFERRLLEFHGLGFRSMQAGDSNNLSSPKSE
jgi:hypothetical protein